MIERMVIVGATGGIGAAVAAHYEPRVGELITVSRTPAQHGTWLRCDVTDPSQMHALAAQLGDTAVDALLYLAGTWEADAFTGAYSFPATPAEETQRVVAVNLTAPILLVQALLPQLNRSPNPRVVLLGSLSGKDHSASPEVANTASKYGLRGAAQAMALALPNTSIGLTVLNPGNVATSEVNDDIAQGRIPPQQPIPLTDLTGALDCILSMSAASVITELDLAQRHG